MNLSKVQSVLLRRFDSIGNGLGFSDFVILYHLYQADDHKLKRIDLADRLGMTASGVTKLLPPMEKIGLVIREASPRDARISYVKLAPGGKVLFEYSVEKANYLAETAIPEKYSHQIDDLSVLLEEMRRLAV